MASRIDLSDIAVAEGFKQLIHVGDSDGIGSAKKTLYDGDGTASDLELASSSVNIKTQLQISGSGITATANELNQLDDKTVGGTNSDDIVDISTVQSLINKTIDGGTF
jgi:hypothetical protein